MRRTPLESTDKFVWPGALNGWPNTGRQAVPTPDVRALVKDIENLTGKPYRVKVFNLHRYGYVLCREPKNMLLAKAYKWLRMSMVPIEVIPPKKKSNGRWVDEIADYLPPDNDYPPPIFEDDEEEPPEDDYEDEYYEDIEQEEEPF